MDTKKVLLFGGLAVGGYLLYRHYQHQQAAAAAQNAAASATPAIPSTLTNPVSIPQSGVIAPPLSSLPNLPAFVQPSPAPLPQVLQNWIPQYLAIHPSMQTNINNAVQQLNAADINMWAECIIAFNNSQPLTTAQSQWWDNFVNRFGLI